jgi:hypothetical protein
MTLSIASFSFAESNLDLVAKDQLTGSLLDFFPNTSSINLMYAEIHSSTLISSLPSMIAIRLFKSAQVKITGSLRVNVPACARSADQIEQVTRLYEREARFLALMVQSVHQILEDIESGQAANAAAVERQQAQARRIDGIWLFIVAG